MADLDQDGWPDLVLNDHGFGVRILWNNAGQFGQPYDLLMGDSHGVSVADFDQDGALEIIVSRGGGSGSNARNSIIYRVDGERNFERLQDFPEPLIHMRGRTVQFADLDHDGAVDLLNFAFPSKEKRGESENHLYRNTQKGTLELAGHLNAKVHGDGQRTLITDIDGDGQQDLLLYGHGPISLHRGNGGFDFEEVTKQWLPTQYRDVTSAVEIDFDNDGDFDIVLSRANAFESGDTFFDEETGTWGFYVRRDTFEFDLAAGDLLKLVNYQSPWPHRHIYIGESAYQYRFPGETHSGKTLDLINSDSLGWPDHQEKQGLHAGYIGNSNWRIGGKIWSPTAGVVKGLVENPSPQSDKYQEALSNILLENRDGKYVDVTAQAGLNAPSNSTGAVVADFDNDGYQDLFFVKRGNLVTPTESSIYRNKGNGTFEVVRDHKVVSHDLGAWGLGGVALDFDRDGKQDLLYANEHGQWHLFKNDTEKVGESLVIDLGEGKAAAFTQLDGILRLNACGLTQTRRVGISNAGYERGYNRYVYFGLAGCSEPGQLTATWTNGETVTQTVEPAGTTKVSLLAMQ
ncbi:VCBS repeat-containing protein [Microbulbifer elongatus]|uniref:VCBS repeat-containing protein n=1 Tax=Microbulbifer elongatus TaxID=86173 RepID=A0ABT1P2P7_9GAMM|nr:VCBS repeat-containing protein [Microbulbifer elongatus]